VQLQQLILNQNNLSGNLFEVIANMTSLQVLIAGTMLTADCLLMTEVTT